MRWSIKSFLARIANRNSETDAQHVHGDGLTPLTDNDLPNNNTTITTLARLDDSSYYQSIQSTASTYLSATEGSLPVEELFRPISAITAVMPKRSNKQIAIKSILKSPTKGRKNTAKRKGRRSLANKKAVWQEAGFVWKEKPTPREQQFMVYMLEMIMDQWDDVSSSEDNTLQGTTAALLPPPHDTPRPYNLDSYEIIERPPSVLDLTVYDADADEFGVFFNQRFVVTNYLMEGSPCGLCEPDINTGLHVIRKPVNINVRMATVVDSYELAPVFWSSPDEFCGEYLEDAQEEAQYKALQRDMVERCNKKDYNTNPRLEEFKNGTWRLTIFEESEEAWTVDEKRCMTSQEIQQLFGLSEAGSIILNVDHIDVVQGRCGYNRGKATRRFMVPLGQEAIKRDRMRDIRRKWSGLFSSYTLAFGNFFGEKRRGWF